MTDHDATPDRRRGTGRLPLFVVAFLMFAATMASNAPSPLYVIYQQRFHFSSLALTAVFASYAAGVLVALVVVGRLSDGIGRRRLLVPSLVMLALSATLFAVADGLGWLFAARAVQGLATGSLTSAATAAMVELEPNGDRRRASLINTVVFITGAAVGPLLFGALVEYLPWPSRGPCARERTADTRPRRRRPHRTNGPARTRHRTGRAPAWRRAGRRRRGTTRRVR